MKKNHFPTDVAMCANNRMWAVGGNQEIILELPYIMKAYKLVPSMLYNEIRNTVFLTM